MCGHTVYTRVVELTERELWTGSSNYHLVGYVRGDNPHACSSIFSA